MKLVICVLAQATLMLAAGTPWAADAPPSGAGSDGADGNVERFLMGGTEIQGTLEQPHVVYVVPWKATSSAVGNDIPLRRSFEQELLEPVDRSHFQRQLSHTQGTGGTTQ